MPLPPFSRPPPQGQGPPGAPKDCTKPRQTLQSPNRLYKAPTDNTRPQQTIQNPKILDKTFEKHEKPKNIKQEPEILNKSSNN